MSLSGEGPCVETGALPGSPVEVSPTRLGAGDISFHPHFLVAGPVLGKRRKPGPAGHTSSVVLILGEDTWIPA